MKMYIVYSISNTCFFSFQFLNHVLFVRTDNEYSTNHLYFMHTDSIIVQNRIIQECWNMDRKREKSIFRLFSFNWLKWLVFSLLFSELLSRDFLPFVLIVFANRITHSFDIMSGEFTYFNRIVGFPSNCSQTSFFNHKWVFYLSFQFLLGSFVSLSLSLSTSASSWID